MRRVRPGGAKFAAARQTKIRIGIAAVFKAPADRERVCILNEPERCRRHRRRRSAMPRGENSATRRPAKRIKKIHEGIALRRSASGRRESARGADGGEKSRTGWSARIASSSGVDNRRGARAMRRKEIPEEESSGR